MFGNCSIRADICSVFNTPGQNTEIMDTIKQPFAQSLVDKPALLKRFRDAREQLGARWKRAMARAYPYYDSREGELIMSAAADALRDERYISRDKLEALVIAMEALLTSAR